jgi:hypothetical protein
MFHRYLALLALVAGLAVVPTMAVAQKGCPANARDASRDLWPRISTGQTVTGMHPCGRRLQCTGGSGTGAGSIRRSCKWL